VALIDEALTLGVTDLNEAALRWLLEPQNPSIRYQTLVDVLGYSPESREAVEARQRIPRHPIYKRIMAGQTKAGYWPRKDTCDSPRYTGALWALILLGEMRVPPDPRIEKECERFFNLHQGENGSFSYRSRLGGKTHYAEPCLTGNMVRTLLVLGYDKDPRVRRAIDWMPEAQLKDGGWNCDYPQFQGVKVRHSSFMSTVEPLWAYSEIPRQMRTRRMKRSIERGAEFLLMHRLYKADHHEWMPMNRTFTTLHYPMYYYYDVLHGAESAYEARLRGR
jgi:squalene-hopene cyclase-like protein